MSVALIFITLMLSLGSTGPEQNDLRLSIARVETAELQSSNLEVAITLENQSGADFMVVLGSMLGNGRMFPTAVTLVLTDQNGRTNKLQYRRYPPRISGRIDDYTVALRSHASYVLRVSLAEYLRPNKGEGRHLPTTDGELDSKLPSGTYSIQATFDGSLPRSSQSDMQGIHLMNFWTGSVSSNVLRFSIP